MLGAPAAGPERVEKIAFSISSMNEQMNKNHRSYSVFSMLNYLPQELCSKLFEYQTSERKIEMHVAKHTVVVVLAGKEILSFERKVDGELI